MIDRIGAEAASPNRTKSYSLSSHANTLSSRGAAEAENRSSQREVRTLPSWIHSVTAEELPDELELSGVLATDVISSPKIAQRAQHNHTPFHKHRPEPGRLHDAARERTPFLATTPVQDHASRWQTFARASAYPPVYTQDGQRVDEQWLMDHMPDLDAPWHRGAGDGDAEKGGSTPFSSRAKKAGWLARQQRALLRNPMVPLMFRLTIWVFSLLALALGASIFALSKRHSFSQRPSTLMAVIFDSVALIYVFYITYDEYTGKPLGLRSAKAKMRLILMDMFFIVFNSANLSLAFDALTDDRWSCRESVLHVAGTTNQGICNRQRALCGVLLVALVAWLLTFAVSVFRLVERVTRE